MAQVIQKSSNVGAAKIQLRMPAESMGAFYRELGFGSRAAHGVSRARRRGCCAPPRSGGRSSRRRMAYGHGISVSLLQIARAYTIFTNDGHLLPISLAEARQPAHRPAAHLARDRAAR